MSFEQKKRLGLALGGGGARGLAHVGALQVLAEAGVQWHAIAGASVGALLGAFLAAGKSVEELSEAAKRVRWWHLARPAWPKQGYLSLAPLENYVRRMLGGDLRFEDLSTPFVCLATDVMTGEGKVFRSGKLAPRIRASCSVPGIFKPVAIAGRLYVDGGMVDNLPIVPLQGLDVDVVLAVNLFGRPTFLPTNTFSFTLMIAGYTLVQAGDDPALADVLVEPDLTGYGMVRLHYHEFVAKGREAMKAKLPQLLAALS